MGKQLRRHMKNFATKISTMIAAIVLAGSFTLASANVLTFEDGQGDTPKQHDDSHHRGGHHFRHHRSSMRHAFAKLNLTDEQKEKAKQIRINHKETIKPLKEQLRAKNAEIRESSKDGNFNEALVTQKMTEMASVRAKLFGEKVKMHQEFLAILTPEQKAKLDEMKSQFKSRRAQHSENF